jgi:hypothetical protein
MIEQSKLEQNFQNKLRIEDLKIEGGQLESQEWGCTTGNAATVAHSTKKTTSGKYSGIIGQPLLLFM